ncbi:MAG: hypothetical protein F6K00_07040 [Leptolyngbya sp. SIOISBB]|nr:hypothetical protein [Leptolyngbya sp. SIOISBB]
MRVIEALKLIYDFDVASALDKSAVLAGVFFNGNFILFYAELSVERL